MIGRRLGFIVAIFMVIILSGTVFAEEKGGSEQEEMVAVEKKDEGIKIVNKIVTLHEFQGATPQTLSSGPGTTIIWVNQSRSPIELRFLDKKVVLACGSPVNFFVNPDGAYESAKIPFGGTASLCFLEKGRYDYEVKVSRTFYMSGDIARDNRGTIWIK